MKSKSNYKSIDLFAGIGGIRLGFEQAFGDDIETVFISEIDAKAKETYRANFGANLIIDGDITKIASEEVPDFDICLAGFPCQAFSVDGKRLGFEDTRGTLFYEVVSLCKVHKPKVIFCENVKGLLRHDNGKTYQTIVNAFEEIGYRVHMLRYANAYIKQVVNNAQKNYFRNFLKQLAMIFPLKNTMTI
jgi:DNA (cytosine-5)-methyltransferase 1